MANFYSNHLGVRFIYCLTTCSFLFGSLPINAQIHDEKAINLHDIAFVARMQKSN